MNRAGIALAFIISVCFNMVYAQFAGGAGTEQDPYQIASVDHFNNVRNYTGDHTHFLQIADVNLGTAPWNEGEGWSAFDFRGYYNGNGFTINNLFINKPQIGRQGLFSRNYGVLQNTGVVNVNVSGDYGVGGLVGKDFGNIFNCFSTGTVTGSSFQIGGLVGSSSESSIEDCYSSCSVFGPNNVGGLVGTYSYSSISKCYSTGSVSGGSFVGGLVGTTSGSQFSSISNCYSKCVVSGDNYIGGLTGMNGCPITNSYSIGSVSGDNYLGGLTGMNSSVIIDSYWNIETSGQTESSGGEGRTTAEMVYPYSANTYIGWDWDDIWVPDQNHSVNQGYPYHQVQTVSAGDASSLPIAAGYQISNHPNPFNPSTTIGFSTSNPGHLNVSVYDIKGRRIKVLKDEQAISGNYQLVWYGMDEIGEPASSGVYFVKIDLNGVAQTHKMIMLK